MSDDTCTLTDVKPGRHVEGWHLASRLRADLAKVTAERDVMREERDGKGHMCELYRQNLARVTAERDAAERNAEQWKKHSAVIGDKWDAAEARATEAERVSEVAMAQAVRHTNAYEDAMVKLERAEARCAAIGRTHRKGAEQMNTKRLREIAEAAHASPTVGDARGALSVLVGPDVVLRLLDRIDAFEGEKAVVLSEDNAVRRERDEARAIARRWHHRFASVSPHLGRGLGFDHDAATIATWPEGER